MVSCSHPSVNPRNTGGGEQGLATAGARGRPGPHQVVQLRVGREQRPLGADLGGRREARQGGPPPARPFCCLPWCLILGLPTCLAKAAMSSLKESEEQTSPPGDEPSPAEAPSRGEHVASSHFSKTRAKSGKRGCLGRTGKWACMRGHMECLETDTRRETDPERHKGHRGAPALSLDTLTHRCHPSPSSSCHCPSLGLGAGEVGVGHRAQGFELLKALPLRSRPGCALQCRGSGAAHHTAGEGANREVSILRAPSPYPRPHRVHFSLQGSRPLPS